MRSRPRAALPQLSTAFLLLMLLAASIALVTGRDLAHHITVAVCADADDCGTFPDSPPVCQYYGRDRVVARESFAFAQQWPADGSRLIQFGDDSAEVIVATGKDTTEVYRFNRWEDAQRWVIDNSTDLGNTADAAAGPWRVPVREGYLRMLLLTGLDHESERAAAASAFLVEEPSGPGTHGVLRQSAEGDIREVTVVMALDEATDELREYASNLGFWGFISYSVDLGPELSPQRLTFSGPATDAWSLAQLRAPSSPRNRPEAEEHPQYMSHENAVLRSFVLDLRQEANAALYREVFAMESILETAVPLLTSENWISAGERSERYTHLEERIRDNAVAVETTHALQDEPITDETVQSAVEGLVVQAGPMTAPETRLIDARTADLTIAGSSFEPLLSCEVLEDDAEEAPGHGGGSS
ncbi:hypothetical protein [Nesterenkonia muleiensis]|uniref:hypothetical protein n=1 Tax=Nesterenkonia muleiensis TaxID=2282648 RepID=UPI0013002146|nr:hypothetical protein [Nesterenkonia muleiensis]